MLEYLESVPGVHITASDVYEYFKKQGASIGQATVYRQLESLVDEDSGLISLYYGEDINEDKAEEVQNRLSEKYEDLEVEIRSGGQPIYYYLLSVE